jgi:triacylglycerol lipase
MNQARILAYGFIAFLFGCTPSGVAQMPTADAPSNPGYTATKYPIVLIHGFYGFKSLIGTVDYFPGIQQALEDGGAQVFVVSASSANDSELRAQQLLPQLEDIRKLTGAPKLNLIGHSQGSMDARLIATTHPDMVASVTAVGGPHRGSPVADFFLSWPLDTGVIGAQAVADVVKAFSGTSDPNDARAALEFLSPKHAAEFNTKYPAALPTTDCGEGEPIVNGIHYYSWGGVGLATNALDPIDPFIAAFGALIPGPSDGLVPRCGSHLGEVLRDDYLANHPDEVNLVFGLISPMAVSPKTIYRLHANRLKNAGL